MNYRTVTAAILGVGATVLTVWSWWSWARETMTADFWARMEDDWRNALDVLDGD